MSCISNNFSSFFLDSLNDPSEFAKYLGNAENKVHTIDDIYNGSSAINNMNGGMCYNSGIIGNNNVSSICDDEHTSVYNHHENHHHHHHNTNHSTPLSITQPHHPHHQYNQNPQQHHHQQHQQQQPHQQQQQQQQHQQQPQQQQQQQQHHQPQSSQNYHHQHQQQHQQQQQQQQHQHQHQNHQHHHDGNSTTFDNSSFEFSKYLRHSEYGETTPPTNNLIDLDNSTPPNRSSNSVDLDNFDHDSKHNNIIFDVHNSNESSTGTGISSIDQKTSSNTSECSDNSNQANNNNCSSSSSNNNYANTRPLNKFAIKDNFDVHPAHKVEEGIFQHMNKLPNKKKETLKQIGVTFTGHMSISDKSIIIDNFARFCEEYGVNDHRPFLTLNQSGMAKSEQIKFARYLGQGLPNFTLFCIYSNFKNLFCTKRFENYIKGNYNLHNILEKTKLFLNCTTNDLKNLTPQQISEGLDNSSTPKKNGSTVKSKKLNGFTNNMVNRLSTLDSLSIIENFDVHPSHRIEDGIFTHMSRLSPKKQELLKQFGIQSNHNVTYQEKNTIIENFMKFCNEYFITDHRAFLDFHDSGLPKIEQIKFARYLGQGLPKLTLYKIYSAFKDLLALNRIDKLITGGYNLEQILKKKKKNLLNRISAIACKERQERAAKAAAAAAAAEAEAEAAAQAATQAAILEAQSLQPQVKLERLTS